MFWKILASIGAFVQTRKFLVTRIINKISKFKLGVGPINLKSYTTITDHHCQVQRKKQRHTCILHRKPPQNG